MKYFKKLVGDRIYLSPRSTEDYEIFTEWMNDFETTDYIGRSGQIQSLSSEKDFLNGHANQRAAFVIVTLDDNKMIGTVCLEDFDDINRTAIFTTKFLNVKNYYKDSTHPLSNIYNTYNSEYKVNN